MEKWFEIFRTGTHTDSRGSTRQWNEEDLDRIVETFNNSGLEAPIVIGHPQLEAPAYGWISKLCRRGDKLLAAARQLLPEFIELVNAGRYKKVSIGLTGDVTLSHVGFLGAMPPAVKGLAEVKFNTADGEITIETDENQPETDIAAGEIGCKKDQPGIEGPSEGGAIELRADSGSDFRTNTAETEQATESMPIAGESLEEKQAGISGQADNIAENNSDVDSKEVLSFRDGLENALQRLKTEVLGLRDQVTELLTHIPARFIEDKQEHNEIDQAEEAARFSNYIESAVPAGRISPAQRDLLGAFASGKEFSETAAGKSASHLFGILRRFIELQPEQPLFREFATQPAKGSLQQPCDFDRARGLITESMKKQNPTNK